jgi:hypothetical protein
MTLPWIAVETVLPRLFVVVTMCSVARPQFMRSRELGVCNRVVPVPGGPPTEFARVTVTELAPAVARAHTYAPNRADPWGVRG